MREPFERDVSLRDYALSFNEQQKATALNEKNVLLN